MEMAAGDAAAYRLAQLDDYARLPRRAFSSHPPLTFSLRARASNDSIPGTWGFGLWNDPFGLSLGFGGNPFRLPALPNATWFFHASEENWLSFSSGGVGRNEIPRSNETRQAHGQARRSAPTGNGFLAQSFRSPKIPSPLLASFGLLSLPILLPILATRRTRKWLRGLAGRVIREDGVRLSVDAAQWHAYRLEWSPTRSAFWVDDALVLESPVSPRPPLGLVIWIDNQYAAFTPEGKIGFGTLSNPEPAWLEIEDVI